MQSEQISVNTKCAHQIKQTHNDAIRNEPIEQVYLQSEPMLKLTNTTRAH